MYNDQVYDVLSALALAAFLSTLFTLLGVWAGAI